MWTKVFVNGSLVETYNYEWLNKIESVLVEQLEEDRRKSK